MIYVKLDGHDYQYEIGNIIKAFYKDEEIRFMNEPPAYGGGIFLYSGIVFDGGCEKISSCLQYGDDRSRLEEAVEKVIAENPGVERSKAVKRELQRHIYILLRERTGIRQPWGILIGIRPAKIVHEMLEKGCSRNRILKKLSGYYMVSEDKAALLLNVAETERSILTGTPSNAVSLYIGMPFCPSRCLYCSFTSNPIDKCQNQVEKYLGALKKEIEEVSGIIREKKYFIQSIYFGGGTPTSIDCCSLKGLLDFIEEKLDLSKTEEYTLEAGRPDSIDEEKLEAIKNSCADRISINPQTMNEATLRKIGRNHTPEDVVRTFRMAREKGFGNINMDLIIGLPGENIEMYENTLREICRLSPESLTVHTMAIKRASRLKEEGAPYALAEGDQASKMVELTQKYSEYMKLHPYYLYRQRNMLGNLENVGYCKPGFESIYNIQIMEEKQTILALGAGAITKVVFREENRIERAFNVKNVEEYIKRVDEMLERKRQLLFS